MDERAAAEGVRHAAQDKLTVQDERPRYGEAPFTRREWRRLVFLRWLYHQGRLTEWP